MNTMPVSPVGVNMPAQVGTANYGNQQPVQESKGTSNLYKKISKVMGAIQYLQKDGQVAFGQTKYRYLSEEKITTEIRTACLKEGLVIFPIEATPERIGTLTQVVMKYKVVDIETGESEILSAVGHGADSQDKGASKAMTAAFKYMQRQTFMIPSGDDPDQVSTEQLNSDPKMLPISPEQINQITVLKNSFAMSTENLKKLAHDTCGTDNISAFTMFMGDRLIAAINSMRNQQPVGQPQVQQQGQPQGYPVQPI